MHPPIATGTTRTLLENVPHAPDLQGRAGTASKAVAQALKLSTQVRGVATAVDLGRGVDGVGGAAGRGGRV